MKRVHNKNLQKGFTLAETIVTLAVVGLIVASVAAFQANVFSFTRTFNAGLSAADHARRVLKPISNELRAAETSEVGNYAISEGTATSVTFFSDIDSDDVAEMVRYYLDGTDIKKEVTEPAENPYDYNSGTTETITIIRGVTNSDIFYYYDTDYDGTTSALTFPITVTDARLIKISLTIDEDPQKDPPPLSIVTEVSFRNLKDNY
ncbi:prepilin-type N-terminal cleavage/methylation domain-containing protein [Candidatus Nomurabacteria bacterium]|nr:prepilin-type N-terminal cleavage/methylation domain-containing protein [Candidatus Nomurabacteria bacterium]USN94739.1 MAG: prepilin-type N-terminal cleavage/methylation domain-containing protein [Candidatus Nomurabacteria bacterium]